VTQAHSHLGSITLKKTQHWLDIAEYATLVGLGVGSITSFVSSQFFYASAPLSLLVLLNLASRNRLEQEMQRRTQQAIAQIDHKVSQNLDRLHQQIQTLPTTEAMGGLRKSMLVKNRELAERLAAEIRTLQDGVQAVLVMIEQLKLGTVREDLDVVRSQYDSLNEGVVALANQVQQMVTSGRFDQMEQAIAQLRENAKKLEANIQSLSDQTKPTLTSLQDQISHLNRQFQKLPPPFDSSALKQEVAELMRMVSDLVPKRDLNALSTELHRLQAQQESQLEAEETLRRKLQEIGLQLQSRPTKSSLTSLQNQINHLHRQFQKLPPPYDPTSLRQEVAKLLQIVSGMVPRRDFSGLIAQVKALQQQQEFQLKIERTLQKELQSLSQQLQELMENPPVAAGASPAAANQDPQTFQERLEATLRQELAQIGQQLQELPTGSEFEANRAIAFQQELAEINRQLQRHPEGPQYEFVLDFKSNTLDASSPALPNSRRILEAALERSQERLIVILPWSSQVNLDDRLLGQMEAFLRQKHHLHVGWCHQTRRTQHRFLKAIQQRWQVQPERQSSLQETLQRLLQLKRIDPQRFQFKIMGTRENFLVSDQQYAVLGMDDALVGTSLPDVELKLRTTDEEVVQQLSQRFSLPAPKPSDLAAHWNLAVTRFDLGDRQGALEGCNQILALTPNDANAYNFRGIVYYEMGDRTAALADFDQAIKCDPHNLAPYCNRGYIRAEQEDQLGAIADYSAALRVDAESGIPYFLRGMSCQKFGEIEGALADYDEALRRVPDSPVLFYYRGLTRPKLGDFGGAIADLQQALEGFTRQGNEVNAHKVQSYLEQLRQAHPNAIVPPPNMPAAPRTTAAVSGASDRESSSEAQSEWPADDSEEAAHAESPITNSSEQPDSNSRFRIDEGLEFSELPLPDPEDARTETFSEAEPVSQPEETIEGFVEPASEQASVGASEAEAKDIAKDTAKDTAKDITDESVEDSTENTIALPPISPEPPLPSFELVESPDAGVTAAIALPPVSPEAETPSPAWTESFDDGASEAVTEGPIEAVTEEITEEITEAVTETAAKAIVLPIAAIDEPPPAVPPADTVILLPPISEPIPDPEPEAEPEVPSIDLNDPVNERLADLDDPFAEEDVENEETADDDIDLTAVNRATNPPTDEASASPQGAIADTPFHPTLEESTFIQFDDSFEQPDDQMDQDNQMDQEEAALNGVDNLATAFADEESDRNQEAVEEQSDFDLFDAIQTEDEPATVAEDIPNPFSLPADQPILLNPAEQDSATTPEAASSDSEDTAEEDTAEAPAIALGPVPEEATDTEADDAFATAATMSSDEPPPETPEAPENTTDTLFDFFGMDEDEDPTEVLTQEPQATPVTGVADEAETSASPETVEEDAIAPSPSIEPSTLGETLAGFFGEDDFDVDDAELAADHPDAERLADAAISEPPQAASSPTTAAASELEPTTETLFSFFEAEDEDTEQNTAAQSEAAAAEFTPAPLSPATIGDFDNPFGHFDLSEPEETSEEVSEEASEEVSEDTESSGTNSASESTQLSIPSGNGRHGADPATLTLSNFLDDLNQAGELDPAIYAPTKPEEEETDSPNPATASDPESSDEPPPANPGTSDTETLSDFCNLF